MAEQEKAFVAQGVPQPAAQGVPSGAAEFSERSLNAGAENIDVSSVQCDGSTVTGIGLAAQPIAVATHTGAPRRIATVQNHSHRRPRVRLAILCASRVSPCCVSDHDAARAIMPLTPTLDQTDG